jgi:hypothetical protein
MERDWDDPPGPTLRKRGRKSSMDLTVVAVDVRKQRPEPPAALTAQQKTIWREIVEKVKPGWFYSSEHLLKLYVQTLSYEQQIAEALRELEVGSKRYLELMRLQRGQVMLAANLAGKLWLTPRSTVDRYTPKIASSAKPWELGQRDEDPPPAA